MTKLLYIRSYVRRAPIKQCGIDNPIHKQMRREVALHRATVILKGMDELEAVLMESMERDPAFYSTAGLF